MINRRYVLRARCSSAVRPGGGAACGRPPPSSFTIRFKLHAQRATAAAAAAQERGETRSRQHTQTTYTRPAPPCIHARARGYYYIIITRARTCSPRPSVATASGVDEPRLLGGGGGDGDGRPAANVRPVRNAASAAFEWMAPESRLKPVIFRCTRDEGVFRSTATDLLKVTGRG